METKIDIKKLISEVEARPALWDMVKGEYCDRVKRKQCWEEIANILSEKDATTEERKKLGDLIHKKWKNIRDRFARDIQERKHKSGDGKRKKGPYMFSQQLEFLRVAVTPKKTKNLLQHANTEKMSLEQPEFHNVPPTTSATPKIGEQLLPAVEQKCTSALERKENKLKMEELENDDNRHFLLSLLPSLAALPRRANMNLRIEMMQLITKYDIADQQQHSTYPNETQTTPATGTKYQAPSTANS